MLQRLRGKGEGFTLIELMIVIAIIGILAAIAIPNFLAYRKKGYNSQANADVKNSYTSCQAYFQSYPDENCSLEAATGAGFRQSENTDCTIDGGINDLTIDCSHTAGNVLYSTDHTGAIHTKEVAE